MIGRRVRPQNDDVKIAQVVLAGRCADAGHCANRESTLRQTLTKGESDVVECQRSVSARWISAQFVEHLHKAQGQDKGEITLPARSLGRKAGAQVPHVQYRKTVHSRRMFVQWDWCRTPEHSVFTGLQAGPLRPRSQRRPAHSDRRQRTWLAHESLSFLRTRGRKRV